jgi:serine/threonine-protein kinase
MAIVYKARDSRLNRFVAVKILKDELAVDDDFRKRFYSESQAVAMLSHPNIVSVYDVSKSGDIEYIVMELIEGITLKQYINRKGQLTWKETLHFTTQITKALSHAHSRGIIHRDIKPHNIMILKDGSVKVADFGIARLQSNQSSTLTQQALGSVHYISPEQAKGSRVDARSDIYSVGVVMYEMLTSRLPFEGDSAVSVAIQHISSVPLMPRDLNPDIPIGLEEITMKAMNPDLNSRYQSADALLRDLEEFRKNPSATFGHMADDVPSGATKGIPVEEIRRAERNAQRTSGSSGQRSGQNGRQPQRTDGGRSRSEYIEKEEYRKKKKKERNTSNLVGVLVVVVFLIAVFLFMWNFFLKDLLDPQQEKITIPKFVGQYYEDVIQNPDYTEHYEFSVTYIESEYEEGYIVSQNPSENRQQVLGDDKIDVSLTVSSGAEINYMPNLVSYDYREARTALERMQLDITVEETWEVNDEITEGYIISTIPAEGEELPKGGTVYLTISSGPNIEFTTVPEVTGVSLSVAIGRLEDRDLAYSVTQVEDPAEAGTVVYQSETSGTEVPKHTEITLQVSTGPAATPSPSPTPTAEPTVEPTAEPTAEPTQEPIPTLPPITVPPDDDGGDE